MSDNYLAPIPEAEEFLGSEEYLGPEGFGKSNVILHDCDNPSFLDDSPPQLDPSISSSLKDCRMPTFDEAAEKPFCFLDLVTSILLASK